MNTITQSVFTGILLISSQVFADELSELEPCINGEVSASGLFASQEAEDSYRQQQEMAVAEWDLEPCINGEVSASGLFTSQEAENNYKQHRISDL